MPSPLTVIIAARPWSWTASLVSVLVAHTLTSPTFFTPSLLRYILIGVFTQTAGNLSNTYFDYRSGCDTTKMKGGDRTLVDDLLSPPLLLVLSVLSGVAAVLTALPLFAPSNTTIFAIGIALTYSYTAPPLKLKYRAMGDFVIIACFGPLLMQFISLVNTSSIDSTVTLFSIPIALITELILHANNTRDIKSDKAAGCTTLAVLVGLEWSKVVFKVFLGSAYLAVMAIAVRTGNYALMLPVLTAPLGVELVKSIELFGVKGEKVVENIDEMVAQFHLPFGLLTVAGIQIGKFM